MNGPNRSKLDAQRRSFLKGSAGQGIAVCTLSLTPAGHLAAQLFPHPDRPEIVIPRQIGKRYYEIDIKYDRVLNDDPPRVLIPHSAVTVSVLGTRGWSSPSPLSDQRWDKKWDLENLSLTVFETPGNDGRRYAEDVGQSVAIKLTLNLKEALRGSALPENAHWVIHGVNMDFRGIRTEELGKRSLPRSKLSANTAVEWVFTPTGATQQLRGDYPTAIPELADIQPHNALQLINRHSMDIFGPAAHVDEEVAILQSITSSKSGVSNVDFARLFVSPNVETSRLNSILDTFESSNITQQNLVASLRNWTEYRANTISLFSRLNSYFKELENDWDFEYEKIVVVFRRPLRVITTTLPKPSEPENDDATYYIGLALAFMTGVPHPLPVIAGVVGTIAISLIDKYNEAPTMEPMEVITPVTGGSTPYVEQLRDQFHQLGIYFRHLFDGLERTALQSYAMMIQCSESETNILNSPQLLSGPKKLATLPTNVVPERSALLKELMRDVWEKLILNELIVKNIYPYAGTKKENSSTYLGSLAGYNGTYDLGNIRLHLFLAGPVADRPAENATLAPPELIERIHWLFDTTEILNLLCNAGRAYVTHVDDDLRGKVYTSEISNLGWFVFWPEIMRRVSQRDKYGKMSMSTLGAWKTWAHQGSNAPWVYPANCSGTQFLECQKHIPPNKYVHAARSRRNKKLVPIPGP